MDHAVQQWKHDFPMHHQTQVNIDAWEKEDIRKSKEAAIAARNGAWKVYLHDTCGSKQLALTFLQYPPAKVDTLLASWATYMKSDGYLREKARSRKVDPDNEKMVQEKALQVKLKVKVHSLRHGLRQVKARKAKADKEGWHALQKEQRKLEEQLQELTLLHGYGKLPEDAQLLLPGNVSDFIPQ